MNRFIENAGRIFDAAENVANSGTTPTSMTILIGAQGGIRMVVDSDWPLDSLQADHGAEMAYRVSQNHEITRVEGRSFGQTCTFQTAAGAKTARFLLASVPNYELAPLAIHNPLAKREIAGSLYA